MHKVRRIALIAAFALALPLVWSSAAQAQYREFTGKVDKITKKKIFVDNRMGDKVSFVKVDETVVEGEKTEWKKIKKSDWVTVSWKMMDKPRKVYKLVVIPKREDAGEDQ